MMARPLVTLHLALTKLPLPCIVIKSTVSQTPHQHKTKINMYRALVVSVLLYGSEAWATTLADRRRLDVFDMRCQRRLLRVFWQQHISNYSIRERTKQPTASSLLRQRRLRWFGHLHRMPARRVYEFNPNIHGWKRPRGRPKT